MPIKERLRPEEKAYVQENCLSKTDAELAKHLNRNIKTIIACRKKMGVIKSGSGTIKEVTGPNNNIEERASQTMTEDQRERFFKTQFANSLSYQILKEQFTEEEVKFYLNEFGSLCVQFEDVVATEKRQIDELIKAEILGNRTLRFIRVAQDENKLLMQEVEDFRRKNPTLSTDEQLQERDNQLMLLIRSFSAQVDAMTNAYQRNVDSKQQLLDELNARRKDRVDSIRKGGTTFIGLVEELRDRENREKEGRYLELVRIAKEQKKASWREPTTFPDGTSDCILVDDKSHLKQKEYRTIRDKSYLIARYTETSEKRILIIDPDKERKPFFVKYLGKNSIDYYESLTSVKYPDSYSLILLDPKTPDIDLLEVDKALKSDIWKQTDILIHSNDNDFTSKALIKLAGKRKVETCSYNELNGGN